MAVPSGASLGPRLERQIQTFDTIPVKESSRIEKYDPGGADNKDHSKIDPTPSLLRRFGIRNTA